MFSRSGSNALKTKFHDYANFVNLLQMPLHLTIQDPQKNRSGQNQVYSHTHERANYYIRIMLSMEDVHKYAAIVLIIKKKAYCHDQALAPTLFVNRMFESLAFKVVIQTVNWKNR